MALEFFAAAMALLALLSFSPGSGGLVLDSILDDNGTMSAQELLEKNGFPGGLLPTNVKGYSLDNSGRFVLELTEKCDVTIPGEYPVEYKSRIKGKLSYGSISDLSGVYVKVFLVWWELTGISMEGSKVVFEVGFLSASYPASNFDESPDCGGDSSSSRPDRAYSH